MTALMFPPLAVKCRKTSNESSQKLKPSLFILSEAFHLFPKIYPTIQIPLSCPFNGMLLPSLRHKTPCISYEAESVIGRYRTHLRMSLLFNFTGNWLYLQNQISLELDLDFSITTDIRRFN